MNLTLSNDSTTLAGELVSRDVHGIGGVDIRCFLTSSISSSFVDSEFWWFFHRELWWDQDSIRIWERESGCKKLGLRDEFAVLCSLILMPEGKKSNCEGMLPKVERSLIWTVSDLRLDTITFLIIKSLKSSYISILRHVNKITCRAFKSTLRII